MRLGSEVFESDGAVDGSGVGADRRVLPDVRRGVPSGPELVAGGTHSHGYRLR